MPTILHTNYYTKEPLNILKKALPPGFELITLNEVSKEELIKKVPKADYILASGKLVIDKDVLQVASKLKMVQRTGVGTNTLDLGVIQEKGIPIYVNRGVNSRSVAEHTIMLMLSVLRRLPVVDISVKSGKWQKQELGVQCNELFGKTVGLIGLGNIGLDVVKMLQVFGVKVNYSKPSRLDESEERKLQLTYCNLADLLKQVDILSLHCPLKLETKELIGKKELSMMKKGSIIINTARGKLIDEEALIKALQTGHLKGVGLDVFENEPLHENSPLLSLNNVVLTPHIGGVTIEAFQRMMHEAMLNIKLFEEGKMEQLESKKLKF
jgi:D-3-phosphoglycerate dehydrogenase / 2-oxoglutarate reductase